MNSQPSRSANIPIPRSPSSVSPSRNIESMISIPFMSPSRPRLPSGSAFPYNSRFSGAAVDEHHGIGTAQGTRGTTGTSPATGISSSSPLTRLSSQSLTPSLAQRGSPHTNTFEPRVIRGDSSRNMDVPCFPPSTSPSRPRRLSTTGVRAPNAQRHSVSVGHTTGNPSSSFPRPAYLEHSALRYLLHTDAPPNSGSRRAEPIDIHPLGPVTSPIDSDEESNVTPPREISGGSLTNLLSHDFLKLPTRWSDQARLPLLSVSPDGRDIIYQGASASGDKDAAAARTDYPIPPACGIYYYEVEILSKGQKGHISIGFAARDVRLSRLPGWEKNSWGYHGDDGYSFAAERDGKPYGPTFGTGDVIGCGVDFTNHQAFYTLNGTLLRPVFENVGQDCDIYPSVGMRHTGESIRVNLGHDPFKFDIDYHVQQRRNAIWANILSTPLDLNLIQGHDKEMGSKEDVTVSTPASSSATEEQVKGPINRLIISYLAHHGYAKTARAFQKQLGDSYDRMPISSYVSSGDADVDMDINGADHRENGSHDKWEDDIEQRTGIVNSVMDGDIDQALKDTRLHYPSVLSPAEGLILFKLKCRKFVELVLEAVELKKRLAEGSIGNKGHSEEDGMVMDVDGEDTSSSAVDGLASTNGFVSSAGGSGVPMRRLHVEQSVLSDQGWDTKATSIAPYEMALKNAITFGQTLTTEYKNDTRLEVQAIFKRTFGILAWDDPIAAGGSAAEVARQEARVALANELNQAILKSQGKPTQPTLETIYRHTAACTTQLGLTGVGVAAFADMQKELLDP